MAGAAACAIAGLVGAVEAVEDPSEARGVVLTRAAISAAAGAPDAGPCGTAFTRRGGRRSGSKLRTTWAPPGQNIDKVALRAASVDGGCVDHGRNEQRELPARALPPVRIRVFMVASSSSGDIYGRWRTREREGDTVVFGGRPTLQS